MKLGEVLSSKKKTLSSNKVLSSSEMTSLQIRNRALSIADGLTSTEKDFTAWYCKAYKSLGEGKYAACASMARQPNVSNPKTLFSYLLKEEMSCRARS